MTAYLIITYPHFSKVVCNRNLSECSVSMMNGTLLFEIRPSDPELFSSHQNLAWLMQ